MNPSVNGDGGPRSASGEAPYVTFLEAMKPLTGKWKIEILWALAQKTRRFGELRRALPGITQHMLTLRLRELEAEGLVKRTVYAENVARVEYEISEAVYGLKPVFQAVIAWSQQYGPLSRRLHTEFQVEPDNPSTDIAAEAAA